MRTFAGSCHCGAIKFQVQADVPLEVDRCNCSICRKGGFLHLIVAKNKFELIEGKNHIQTYKFGSGIAKHTFCKHCGIKPFYIPRSNPDGVDINVNCLDEPQLDMQITDFDGQNWERHAHKLAHKSK
ncbi:MAG: GFA family protein [Alteromonadaceae bacterium]|nr:GFA family protein [Alteromonadaceae bacterium]